MAESIKYIGASTHDLDLFEGQYSIPNGMAYNSYVIEDEKIAIMDTVDKIVTDKWLENLKKALDGREPEYLVVQHLEPDHSGNINTLLKMYEHLTLVCTAKAKAMLEQFDIEAENVMAVKEGDELSLGSHTLKFILAPMVHWPEVMMKAKKPFSQLTHSENSVHLMLMKIGAMRQEDIISILSANTAYPYLMF